MGKILKLYGVVNVSVANMHAKPDLKSTINTQALLGTGVTILKRKGDWQYVRLPDNYCGWTSRSLTLMTLSEYNKWQAREKIIVTAAHAFAYKTGKADAPVMGDAVIGCCFALKSPDRKSIRVQYPDKRIAFIKKQDVDKLLHWEKKLKLSAKSVIATARRFMGVPYLWGGTSAKALDCSGLVRMAFWLNGMFLPRNSQEQARVGLAIDKQNAQPGDLLFFGRKKAVTHVGIYLGNDKFIHASGDVHISSLARHDPEYDRARACTLIFVKRIIGRGAPAL